MIYFTLEEMLKTSTGLKNIPTWEDVHNLELLCSYLDTLRMELKAPIYVNSGYRSKEVNKAVGGATNSLHTKGLAADIRAEDINKLYTICKSHLSELQELGAYYNTKGALLWLHLGLTRGTPQSKHFTKVVK